MFRSAHNVDVKFDEVDDVYHQPDGYESSSKLKDWLKCPSYYGSRYLTSTTPGIESASIQRGKLAHWSLQVGREATKEKAKKCPEEFVTTTGISKSKKAKEFFASEDPGTIWLTPSDAYFLECMWKGFHDNMAVERLYEEVKHSEVSIRWERDDGFKLKCRPDAITQTGLCLDYKTCRHVDPLKEFIKSVKEYAYHVSCALYQEGCAVAGFANQPQTFIVISTVAPFAVHAVRLPKEAVVKGRRLLEQAIQDLHAHRVLQCRYEPRGYGVVHTLDLPKWF